MTRDDFLNLELKSSFDETQRLIYKRFTRLKYKTVKREKTVFIPIPDEIDTNCQKVIDIVKDELLLSAEVTVYDLAFDKKDNSIFRKDIYVTTWRKA